MGNFWKYFGYFVPPTSGHTAGMAHLKIQSRGLAIVGGDSCLRGPKFKSCHEISDGYSGVANIVKRSYLHIVGRASNAVCS